MKKTLIAAFATTAFAMGCASYKTTIYGPIGDSSGQKVKVEADNLNSPDAVEKAMKELSDKCPTKEVINFYSFSKHMNFFLWETWHHYLSGNCKQAPAAQ